MRKWFLYAFLMVASLFWGQTQQASAESWLDSMSSNPFASSSRTEARRAPAQQRTANARRQSRSDRAAYASNERRPQRQAQREARPARQTRQTRTASLPNNPVAGFFGSLFGIASYYWQPQAVASGGRFNPNAMTAAHKTLPFGTRVRVTHLGNGRSVDVTINDRGPYVRGRIIDLSKAAAAAINMQGQGVAQVRVDILGRN